LKKAGTICPWVFHRDRQRIKDVRGAWTAATKAAGCQGLWRHDCRRSAVRQLVGADVAKKTVQQLTGHKSRSVFDRYHIVTENDLRQAVARLAGPVVPGERQA
jgi:integrase